MFLFCFHEGNFTKAHLDEFNELMMDIKNVDDSLTNEKARHDVVGVSSKVMAAFY